MDQSTIASEGSATGSSLYGARGKNIYHIKDGYIDEEMGLIGKRRREDPELAVYGGRYKTKYQLLQVSIRLPESDPLAYLAIAYGFIMYVIPASLFFAYCARPTSFLFLYGFAISIVTVVISEVMLKPQFCDPRPLESANTLLDGTPKPGMPSGHAANAYALLVWSVCELLLHSTEERRYAWIATIFLALAPIPWARWYNRDHTVWQTVIGSLVGSILGAIYVLTRLWLFP